MKKLNYFLLGLAGLTLASCANEDITAPGSGDGNVSITISLPGDGPGTRFGEGTASEKLNYAVYTASTANGTTSYAYAFGGVADFGPSTSTTLGLNLLNKQYRIAFFAQSEASMPTEGDADSGVYTFTAGPSSPSISVDYANMNSDDNLTDAYDCFYNTVEVNLSPSNTNPTTSFNVKLYRPVAQVNWGTNDLAAPQVANAFGPNGSYIMATLNSETALPTSLDLFSGVATAGTEKTIGGENGFAIPSSGTYPVSGYSYVALQYILVGAPDIISGTTAEANIYDLTLSITNDGDATVEDYDTDVVVVNAPLKANYQTNIYGNLLSNNTTFNIEVMPGFAGQLNVPQAWDGKTVTYPTVSADGKTYTASQASDLAGLIDMINGTNGQTQEDFEGKTIELTADVDMGSQNFDGIGIVSRSGGNASGNSFKGVFDGKGNTIKNLTMSSTTATGNDVVGFIGNLDGEDAALQNVTFENLQINAPNAEQAGVVGLVTNGATVSNVTVSSGSVSTKESAGGIVGRMMKDGSIDNCTNYASVNSTEKNAGGIVGSSYYTSEEGTLTVSNCNNYGKVSGNFSVGGVVGINTGTVESCNNYGEISGSNNAVGGVVGLQQSAGYIKDCVNEGTVTATTNVWGTGGIAGWVKYDNNKDSYPVQNRIEVTGCTNKANIIGGTNVGGIVGSWYASGTCSNNFNYAEKIQALDHFVAGIIGSQTYSSGAPAPTQVENPEDVMLYVNNNTSTTAADNIIGTNSALIIYVNVSANVTGSGNNPDQSIGNN